MKHIRHAGIRPQLVVVSPLTRALQTATGVYASCTGPAVVLDQFIRCSWNASMRPCRTIKVSYCGPYNDCSLPYTNSLPLHFQLPAAVSGSGCKANIMPHIAHCACVRPPFPATPAAAFGSGPLQAGNHIQPPLMAEISEPIPRKQVPHAAISAEGAPPFLAHELCREHIGIHPCDRRRPTSHYRAAFPGVEYSLIEQVRAGRCRYQAINCCEGWGGVGCGRGGVLLLL